MSLSKGYAAATPERTEPPKCSRCRHHGIITPKKGHSKYCPFLECQCWKCGLTTQRMKITALQRDLRRAKNEPRPRSNTGAKGVNKQAGEESFCTPNPDGGAPSTSRGTPERTPPPGPWSGHPAGGQPVSGLDARDVLPPPAPSENCTPLNLTYFGELGQMAPLPLIQFPFRMPGYYPGSHPSPSPHFLPNMPWLPLVPAMVCKDGLFGPLMFPPPQQGALNYPPPPEPGPPADCRQAFFTFHPPPGPRAFQGELMSRQDPIPPQPKTTDHDAGQQNNTGNKL